jgi:hypothetical protein
VPITLTFEKLEDRKAALGKRRLLKMREDCVRSPLGHDWATLPHYAASVVQYCRHCLALKNGSIIETVHCPSR